MLLKLKKLLTFVFILIFLLFSNVNSSVEVFSNYDTVLNISSDGKIYIEKDLTLKNIYDVGIVPGQIEFKIGRSDDGRVVLSNNSAIEAYDQFGKKIDTHVRNSDDFTTIVLDVYYPLLPGFSYSFNLKYELNYKSGGIFFNNLEIPLRESTIAIEKGSLVIKLPSKYRFTFVDKPDEDIEYELNKNVLSWNIKDDLPKSISFEYSYIPIRVFNVRGSYVFWIAFNLLLFILLINQVKKEIRKYKSENA